MAATTLKSGLEEVERDDDRRLPFLLTKVEVKLLGIAGIGFLLDAYDLFIINQIATMLQYRLYDGHSLPANLEGFVKAGANIGAVAGQLGFGYLADALGRKAIYGKELMIIILATILTLATPTGLLSPDHSLIYLGSMRIFLGIGIGGDYPMASTIMTDRAVIRKRGALLSYIFSNQGWGSLCGSIITMIVLLAYRSPIDKHGEVTKVDGVWRIVVGVSLVPAFGTLYQRLVLPESRRYKQAQENRELDDIADLKQRQRREDAAREGGGAQARKKDEADADDGQEIKVVEAPSGSDDSSEQASVSGKDQPVVEKQEVYKKAHFREFLSYFAEWRHAKILIGTTMCWFLLDVAFYGINLNQSVVLQQIGYEGKDGTAWEKLFNLATGNLIVTALGFVPGYWVTILTVEYLGRKWIQIQGFIAAAVFLAILAAKFHTLATAPFIVCFAFLQFFFNFGANTTTFLYPAEVFPTRFRASAHGISAACGKAGAIVSSLAFNSLSKKIGTPAVLWIFVGCCVAGAGFTLLLPEVKGRDPDEVDRLEREEGRKV